MSSNITHHFEQEDGALCEISLKVNVIVGKTDFSVSDLSTSKATHSERGLSPLYFNSLFVSL